MFQKSFTSACTFPLGTPEAELKAESLAVVLLVTSINFILIHRVHPQKRCSRLSICSIACSTYVIFAVSFRSRLRTCGAQLVALTQGHSRSTSLQAPCIVRQVPVRDHGHHCRKPVDGVVMSAKVQLRSAFKERRRSCTIQAVHKVGSINVVPPIAHDSATVTFV